MKANDNDETNYDDYNDAHDNTNADDNDEKSYNLS